jgi:pimeloyl-ACP methyl ester carboxylesterase
MKDTAPSASLLEGPAQLCADLSIPHIDDGSHWVIHERPARVNAQIAQALDEAC